MADALCAEWGFELRRTFTGFKFIGEQIGLLEAAGQEGRFAFGFEESYGYLAGTHVRDKDAVVASMLICEMARWYRARGMDLIDAMEALYEKYGYYRNGLVSLSYPGAEGAARMAAVMSGLRGDPPAEVAGRAHRGGRGRPHCRPSPPAGAIQPPRAAAIWACLFVPLAVAVMDEFLQQFAGRTSFVGTTGSVERCMSLYGLTVASVTL